MKALGSRIHCSCLCLQIIASYLYFKCLILLSLSREGPKDQSASKEGVRLHCSLESAEAGCHIPEQEGLWAGAHLLTLLLPEPSWSPYIYAVILPKNLEAERKICTWVSSVYFRTAATLAQPAMSSTRLASKRRKTRTITEQELLVHLVELKIRKIFYSVLIYVMQLNELYAMCSTSYVCSANRIFCCRYSEDITRSILMLIKPQTSIQTIRSFSLQKRPLVKSSISLTVL